MKIPELSHKRVFGLLYNWSPSKLDKWLCPLQFYFNYILQLSGKRLCPAIFVFGSVIHKMMEVFFLPRMKNGFKNPDTFLSAYHSIYFDALEGKTWRGHEWHWAGTSFENKNQKWALYYYGRKILTNFFWKNIHYYWDKCLRKFKPLVEKKLTDRYFEIDRRYPGGIFTLTRIVDRIQRWPDKNGLIKTYTIDYKLSGQRQLELLRGRDWAHIAEEWLSQIYYAPYGGSFIYPLANEAKTDLYVRDPLMLYKKIQNKSFGVLKKEELEKLEPVNQSHFRALRDRIVTAKEQLFEALRTGLFNANSGDHCKMCMFRDDCRNALSGWDGQELIVRSKMPRVLPGIKIMPQGKQLRLGLKRKYKRVAPAA